MIVQEDKCCSCDTPRAELKDVPWGWRISPGVWGIKCQPCREKELQEQIEAFQKSEPDTQCTDDIICPNCGHKHEWDSEEEAFYRDGDNDFECGNCDEEFVVNTSVSYYYSSYKKDEKNSGQ